jgi:uncharacterized RDD family membrane protein YckC
MSITLPMLYRGYGSQYWDSTEVIMGAPDFIISWIFPFAATTLFWIYKSATPSKIAVRAKIVDEKTRNLPTLMQSIIRYIAYFVSPIAFCLGFLWIAWDKKKQGWHDKLAGTVVRRPISKSVKSVDFSSTET